MTLTQDTLKSVLHYDRETGVFTWVAKTSRGTRIGRQTGYRTNRGYIQISVFKTLYVAHRLAWFYEFGVWPTKDLDHVNGVKDDNRIKNLREATKSQNAANAKRQYNNRSGCKGVTWHKPTSTWQARIKVNGRERCLGYFKTVEEAASARKTEAAKAFGEYARH